MKKKALMVLISLFMLSILAGCSNEKVNEKLNELLFVNKIISYIEIEETDKVEEEKTDVVVLDSNPFIEGGNSSSETKDDVSSLDTFVYLDWGTYSSNIEVDLDLIALLVDKNGKSKIENLISFNNFGSDSAVHMGDDSEGVECIYLNLNILPKDIEKVYFFCYNYENEWDNLSKLSIRLESLVENYEGKIRLENFENEDSSSNYYGVTSENVVSTHGSIPASAIKLGVYERRGPMWYLNDSTESIKDLNAYFRKFGIVTSDYDSLYFVEKAKEEARLAE